MTSEVRIHPPSPRLRRTRKPEARILGWPLKTYSFFRFLVSGFWILTLVSGFWLLLSGASRADDLTPNGIPDSALHSAEEVPDSNQSYPGMGAPLPQTLESLQRVEATEEKQTAGFEVRTDSQKDAALSYGLRGGLAWRTYEINQRLERFSEPLSRTYNFRELLMGAPGGVYVEPPIIEEQLEALKIVDQGQSAALTDKILTISANAKLVTSPRDWRTYLERSWGKPEPPPNSLLPKTREEQDNWGRWVKEGWQKGIEQADDIFAEDMARLNRDFTGMVRYRKLLVEAVVSAPYAGLVERGVTGGGLEMRIGDRAVSITGPAQLKTQSDTWRPITITQPH